MTTIYVRIIFKTAEASLEILNRIIWQVFSFRINTPNANTMTTVFSLSISFGFSIFNAHTNVIGIVYLYVNYIFTDIMKINRQNER